MRHYIDNWLGGLSEKTRQWVWFVFLWCCGLGSVMLLGYVIRFAMGID